MAKGNGLFTQLERYPKEYPDHLQQIWELGEYLRDLKDIYNGNPVPIVKQVLSDMGIIESPAHTLKSEDISEMADRMKELMKNYGDYH